MDACRDEQAGTRLRTLDDTKRNLDTVDWLDVAQLGVGLSGTEGWKCVHGYYPISQGHRCCT
jgi:hypothetical protein